MCDDFHRVFVIVMYEWLPMFYYNCGLIGHGSNACTKSVPTRASGSPLPNCDEQPQVEGFNQVSESMNQQMVSSETLTVLGNSENHPVSETSTLETDYGP